jgi:hypothetical protein
MDDMKKGEPSPHACKRPCPPAGMHVHAPWRPQHVVTSTGLVHLGCIALLWATVHTQAPGLTDRLLSAAAPCGWTQRVAGC